MVPEAQNHEGSGNAERPYQVVRKGCHVDRRQTYATNHNPSDQALARRWEPFDGWWGSGGVTQANSHAAHNAKRDQHQPGGGGER